MPIPSNAPLFRTIGGCDRQDRGQGRGREDLTADRMARQDARRMVIRRARKARLITKIGCHSFRATGITVYLLNGGLLEYAQQMGAQESARTTKLYDRRNDQSYARSGRADRALAIRDRDRSLKWPSIRITTKPDRI